MAVDESPVGPRLPSQTWQIASSTLTLTLLNHMFVLRIFHYILRSTTANFNIK